MNELNFTLPLEVIQLKEEEMALLKEEPMKMFT